MGYSNRCDRPAWCVGEIKMRKNLDLNLMLVYACVALFLILANVKRLSSVAPQGLR